MHSVAHPHLLPRTQVNYQALELDWATVAMVVDTVSIVDMDCLGGFRRFGGYCHNDGSCGGYGVVLNAAIWNISISNLMAMGPNRNPALLEAVAMLLHWDNGNDLEQETTSIDKSHGQLEKDALLHSPQLIDNVCRSMDSMRNLVM